MQMYHIDTPLRVHAITNRAFKAAALKFPDAVALRSDNPAAQAAAILLRNLLLQLRFRAVICEAGGVSREEINAGMATFVRKQMW